MIIIKRQTDLTRLCRVENMAGVTFTGEQDGHKFIIEAMRDNERVELSGSVTGRFIRPDGVSVALTASENYAGIDDDGMAWVTLAANCYTVAGPFGLVITHIDSGKRTVIFSCTGYVRPGETSTIVDPENIINIDAIMGIIDDMQDALTASTIATAAANAAATGAVANFATAYAAEKAYKAGDYITYSGGFYRITADISASDNTAWSAVSKVQVTAGDQISDLKSAISNLENVSVYEISNPLSNQESGTNKWEVSNGVVSVVSAGSYCHAAAPVTVNPGNVVHIIFNSQNGESVIFANYANDVYTYVSGESFGRINNVECFYTIPSGVNCILLNKYGAATQYCNYVVQKTDATLTEENVPAQGKVVGDQFTAVDGRLDVLETSTGEDPFLHDKTEALIATLKVSALGGSVWTKGKVMNSSGVIINAQNSDVRYYAAIPQYVNISQYAGKKIAVESTDDYTKWVRIAFLDSSKNIIGERIQVTSEDDPYKQLTVPQTAVYANFSGYSYANYSDESIASTQIYFFGASGDEPETVPLALRVPDYYELVVGDTFQLFYRGIVLAARDTDYDIVVSCSKGSAYSKFYQFTPTAAGDVTMTITLYDTSHKQVDTATVTLKVKAKASSPSSMKTVLYVGDSLTSGGYAPGEFKRRLVGTGGTPDGDGLTNIQFIGTKTNNDCNYEGQGGWTFKKYNEESSSNDVMWITCADHGKTDDDQHSIYKDSNDKEWKLETIESGRIMIIRESASGTLPSTGTLTWVSGGVDHDSITYTASEQAPGNPFWDSTASKVDFGTYATARGVSSIDYVYVLLGWNGAGGSDSSIITNATTFIDNVLTSFPSCKIVLLGLEAPSRDGLGVSYGASGLYSRYFDLLSYVFHLNDLYKEIADSETYSGKVFFVNVSGQFDTEHNMMTGTRKVNVRSATTETYQTNGVHPAVSGYYQIADACYRDFMHRLQDT